MQRFPHSRLRRSRQANWSRELIKENTLTTSDLIWPVFVTRGQGVEAPIDSMPGVFRYSVDVLVERIHEAAELGIRAVAVFPETDSDAKSPDGSEALNPDNLACSACRAISELNLDLGVICDVALDPYTDHGHDGILKGGKILNDETVDLLCQQAVVQAKAGCSVIAPSDMMDGRIGKIRESLDQAGFKDVLIMAYAAKYASAFYGPFRDAIGSTANLAGGSKKTYQMDPANALESLREVAMDIDEGADWVMVKPGMPYLDIVQRVKSEFGMPTFAYQVSGEYAMLVAAAQNGWLNRDIAIMESLLCFKRAGCDGVLSYFAVEVARRLSEVT